MRLTQAQQQQQPQHSPVRKIECQLLRPEPWNRWVEPYTALVSWGHRPRNTTPSGYHVAAQTPRSRALSTWNTCSRSCGPDSMTNCTQPGRPSMICCAQQQCERSHTQSDMATRRCIHPSIHPSTAPPQASYAECGRDSWRAPSVATGYRATRGCNGEYTPRVTGEPQAIRNTSYR